MGRKAFTKQEEAPGGVAPFRITKKDNTNGWEPYRRMLIVWTLTLVICIGLGYLAWEKIILPTPPHDAYELTSLFPWFFSGMVVPHFILFFLSAALSVFIITQSTVKYAWWVLWNSMGRLLVGFFTMECIIIAIVLMIFTSQPDDSFISVVDQASGMTDAMGALWNAAVLLTVSPAWVGYCIIWACYRKIGAQKMQDRYEEFLRITEIKNSGRMWDRLTKIHLPRILGSDGSRPPGIFLGVILNLFLFIPVMAFAFTLSSGILYGVAIFGVPLGIIALWAAHAKRRDGRLLRKHPPRLLAVRGPDTVDEYDPSHTGVIQFQRL